MGILATPTEQDREQIRGLARQITDAVVNDEEGPLALPDLKGLSFKQQLELLKQWWEETDFKTTRLAQDFGDTSQALEIACALLARFAPSIVSDLPIRLRKLDIPEQAELDAIAKADTEAKLAADVTPATPEPMPTPTLDPRLMELLDRVTGTSGAVANTLSASEWHELREELETFRYKAVGNQIDDPT